jgi:hypothetical protein
VSGRYRGYPIDATFPPSSCGFVPGPDDAPGVWSYLMDDAGPGVAERDFGHAPRTRADREQSRQLVALRARDRRLSDRRRKALSAGNRRLGPRPDKTALAILRDFCHQPGPEPFDAQVYTTTNKLAPASGGESQPDAPVYVVVLHYAYRDYAGHRHRASDSTFAVYDAKTLESTSIGYPAPLLGRLGHPVTLTF